MPTASCAAPPRPLDDASRKVAAAVRDAVADGSMLPQAADRVAAAMADAVAVADGLLGARPRFTAERAAGGRVRVREHSDRMVYSFHGVNAGEHAAELVTWLQEHDGHDLCEQHHAPVGRCLVLGQHDRSRA